MKTTDLRLLHGLKDGEALHTVLARLVVMCDEARRRADAYAPKPFVLEEAMAVLDDGSRAAG